MSKVMVETSSSGSDCKCKCIVSAKEGEPCSDGSSRQTVYLVETIPIGSDCRCSCNTPAPTGCENKRSNMTLRHTLTREEEELDVNADELQRNLAKLTKVISRLNRMLSKHKAKTKVMRRERGERSQSGFNNHIARKGNPGEKKHHKIMVPSLVSTDTKLDVVSVDSNNEESGDNDDSDNHLAETQTFVSNSSSEIPIAKLLEEQTPLDTFNLTTSVYSTVAAETTPVTTATASTTPASTATTSTPLDDGNRLKYTHTFYRSKPKEDTRIEESIQADDTYEYEYEYDDEFDRPVIKSTETSSITTTTTTPSSSSSSTTLETPAPFHRGDGGGGKEEYVDDQGDYVYGYDYYEDYKTTTTTTTTATPTPQTTDPCGTLYRLSQPKVVGSFGRKQGAWMRDSVRSSSDPARSQRIYVTNFYFGDILLEFDDLEKMKKLEYGNSYNLPHKWIGTGHIVYNGSFYFNRAFSTSLIKYDLKSRSVNAWSRLAHAVYQTWVPLDWRGHFLVHLAADEHGLWVIYPSRDPSQPQSKLTYIINKIDPNDLSILESYKTKVRQPPSHFFIICGILYSTTGYNSRNARVTDAFDTRTLARRTIFLGIEHPYSYTVQFSYNPADRKIYAWDNGRQVEYKVEFVY